MKTLREGLVEVIKMYSAQGYCTERNENKILDPDLLVDIAESTAQALEERLFVECDKEELIRIIGNITDGSTKYYTMTDSEYRYFNKLAKALSQSKECFKVVVKEEK